MGSTTEFSEWLGGERWDPDEVSVDAINGRLKHIKRV
jgi:hypothetical protein